MFAGRIPGELRLVLFLVAVAVVWLLYRKAAARPRERRTALFCALRIALVVLLIFVLGGPALRIRDAEKGEPLYRRAGRHVALDVDFRRASPGGPISRIRAANDVLFSARQRHGLLAEISQDSQVILYSFSDIVKRARPRELADAQGSFTNMFRAVRDVEAELRAGAPGRHGAGDRRLPQ